MLFLEHRLDVSLLQLTFVSYYGKFWLKTVSTHVREALPWQNRIFTCLPCSWVEMLALANMAKAKSLIGADMHGLPCLWISMARTNKQRHAYTGKHGHYPCLARVMQSYSGNHGHENLCVSLLTGKH